MDTPELEERGLFWWTDDKLQDHEFAPPNSVYGVLKIDNDGSIEVELDNVLPSAWGYFDSIADNQPPITRSISGILKNSRQHVILCNLWKSASTWSSRAPSHEKYGAWTCLVSQSPLNRTGTVPRFRNMTIPLDGYEEWLGFGRIQVKSGKTRAKIKWNLSGNYIFRLHDKTIRLVCGVERPPDGIFLRSITYKSSGHFDFAFKKYMTIDDILRQHKRFEDLLILLSNFEQDIAWPVVSVSKTSHKAKLYYRRMRRPGVDVEQLKCWVAFPHIIGSFDLILRLWDEKSASLGAGIFMYTGTRRGVKLFEENRFTNLIVGLESLHRLTHKLSQNSNIDEKISRILGDIKLQKDKTWLRGKLKRSGEPSLQYRLIEVVKDLPIEIPYKMLTRFALRCADFRNKIAHEGGFLDAGEQAIMIQSLSKITPALESLYHACILKLIGIDEDRIRRIFSKEFVAYELNMRLFIAGLIEKDPSKEHEEAIALATSAHKKTDSERP
jgi:hypothetical protein